MQKQTVQAEIQSAITTDTTRVTVWRARAIAFLRIAFGILWAIDAFLKSLRLYSYLGVKNHQGTASLRSILLILLSTLKTML